jgi:peroxiredoxin
MLDQTWHQTAARRPQIGDPLPDLTLRGLNGQPFSLRTLRGKRSLVFMWASW